MQKKQDKKKKTKKQGKVHDLKPSKEAKGGGGIKYPNPIFRGGPS